MVRRLESNTSEPGLLDGAYDVGTAGAPAAGIDGTFSAGLKTGSSSSGNVLVRGAPLLLAGQQVVVLPVDGAKPDAQVVGRNGADLAGQADAVERRGVRIHRVGDVGGVLLRNNDLREDEIQI